MRLFCENGRIFYLHINYCKSTFCTWLLRGLLKKEGKKKSRLVFSWLLYMMILFKNLNTEK